MEPLTLAVVLFALSFLHGMVVEQWRERLAQARSGPGEGTAASYDSLTIIVPTRNAAGTLIPLLQDLHAQDLPKERVEVLVVDDHSEDDTAAVVHSMGLKWPELRCISNDGVGKKAAITTGVTHASGEVILLTDADARCGVSVLRPC
jgi:biofilm PGA synthesis N-glycosyltransferase PgaC